MRGRAEAWLHRGRSLGPGLLVATMVAMAAAFLGSHYKGSMLLFALLLGMALGFLGDDARCRPGIQFAGSSVLRIGVALLGLRLTVEHVAALGWGTVLALAVAVLATMACALLLARVLGIHRSFGVLAGGATAICGASAALAIASVLPRREGLDRDTTLTVVGVTTLSTLAMILYPVLSTWLGFDATTAGRFIGATIHDVAQVVGAGYALSEAAGDAATITKLMRVALLLPTLLLVALLVRSREAGLARRAPLLPWFAVAFGLLVLVNSSGLVPATAQALAGTASQAALVVAIAAVGLKTSLREVATLGWRPVLLLVLVTVWLAALAAAYLRFGA
ncbi:YeiH family protein [Ramlibacter tataouinensis]|uniref:Candidate membrane protein n=1 Tax=Ramlibacter tataouinensis (strain ATCC BAA-407 / DSM 14655 / LMG 21543 / TTB310) TaxID=365046 RepID=F5Y4I7_RAMTT|nr:putative sulfate exporter family transporter [Ramlibacter tataouinensis]AEG93834.1 candidate membrane protein [Ramlibacter tataouinensis TTB310]